MSQFIDFIYVKNHADFTAVCAHYGLKLVGRGEECRALCPFHDDTEPSLSINLTKNVFNCFSGDCDARGNILEFVAEMEETDDLRSAAVQLAEISGCELADPATKRMTAKGKKKSDPKGSRWKARRKAQNPPEPETQEEEPEATEPSKGNEPLTFKLKLDAEHPYGEECGVSSAIIDTMEMGYCSRGMMADRWCIPIHNSDGELVAYAGRWVDEDLPKGTSRYLLPPDFVKTLELFNLHRIQDPEHVVIVEGYFGAIRLHALWVPVVALMGSSISEEQVALMENAGVKRITLMLDGDKAGRTAAGAIVPVVAQRFFVRDVVLPDGTEPDTVPEAFVFEHVERLEP